MAKKSSLGLKTVLLLALMLYGASAHATAPVLFFTDLVNGPATGNSDTTYETGGGVYVTIYGNFLGATQGGSTITLNGSACLHVITWGQTWLWYQRIVVQLKSTCATGNFVVTTSSGTSNTLPFTVNSGTIYYVATTGNDGTGTGSFSAPWRTMPHAVQTAGASAGSIIYVLTGVTQLADDGSGAGAYLGLLGGAGNWCGGTISQPDVLAAYPGATGIQVGPTNGTTLEGLRSYPLPSTNGCVGNWEFHGILFGGSQGVDVQGSKTFDTSSGHFWGNWGIYRFVADEVATGGQSSGVGCHESAEANVSVFGNNIHDCNTSLGGGLAQGLYFSADCDNCEAGWNSIKTIHGRGGLQLHSSPLSVPSSSGDETGYGLWNISLHDNQITSTDGECITLDTINPAWGYVLVYNNVCWHNDISGANRDQFTAAHNGDYQYKGFGPGNSSGGTEGSGPNDSPNGAPYVLVYNNTFYCDEPVADQCLQNSYNDISSGPGFPPTDRIKWQNNILYSVHAPYWSIVTYSNGLCGNTDTQVQCPTMLGDHNLFFNQGTPTFPNLFTSNLNVDPKFVTNGSDFHLQSGSPAIGAGVVFAGVTGAITGVFVDAQGTGYTSNPSCTPASGAATFTNIIGSQQGNTGGNTTKMQVIRTTNQGSGYSPGSPPAITCSGGGASVQATLRAIVGNLPALTYDVDGNIRPNPPSMGAYEFASASPPTITTTGLPSGQVGVAYTTTLAATSGTPPYTWSMAPTVAGLFLNVSTGVLAGDPSNNAVYSITFTVTDSASQSAMATLPLTIILPPSDIGVF